jgi:hypothetical protein
VKCNNCGGIGHTASRRNSGERKHHRNESAHITTDDGDQQDALSYVEHDDGGNGDSDDVSSFSVVTSKSRVVIDTGGRDWIVDGGATAHHTGNRSLLTNIRRLDTPRYSKTGNKRSSYNEIGDAV